MAHRYAGLGSRTAAFAWDYLIILAWLALAAALGLLLRRVFPGPAARVFARPLSKKRQAVYDLLANTAVVQQEMKP